MFSQTRFLLAMMAVCTVLVQPHVLAQKDALDADADKRLAKTVTLYFPPTPLGELLQKVGQQTGVTLNAERSIAQHRAILVVHEKPLHECLQRLADAFGYTWQKVETKGKPPRYMLYQSSRSLAEERTQLAQYQQLTKQVMQEMLRTLEGIDSASMRREWERYRDAFRASRNQPPPPAKSREEAIRQVARILLGECSISWDRWSAAVLLAKLPPPMWARLEQGETLEFLTTAPDSLLTPDFLRIWREVEEESLNNPSPFGEDERMRELRRRNLQQVDAGRIRLALHPITGQPMYATAMLSGFRLMQFSTLRPLWYSPHEVAYLLDALLHRAEQSTPSEPMKKIARPLQEVNLSLSEQVDRAGNLLARFARANEVNLAGEWYPYPPSLVWNELIATGSQTGSQSQLAWQPMVQFLNEFRYDLQTNGDWLVLTQRLRALCRHHDIPEPTIRRWLWKRGREGELDLQDVMEICALLPDQITSLMYKIDRLLAERKSENYPPGHLREMGNFPQVQMAVLALASLPPALRNVVLQGNPLPFATLPAQTRRYLMLAVHCNDFPNPVPWERALFVVRTQEYTREEPQELAPQRIKQGFYTQEYEDWLNSLSEQERREYLRPRFTRRIQFVIGDGQTDYFVTELMWEHWLRRADESSASR